MLPSVHDVDNKEQVNSMLQEAKIFVSIFDEFVLSLSENDISIYKEKLEKIV